MENGVFKFGDILSHLVHLFIDWSILSGKRVVWEDVGEFGGIVEFSLLNECDAYFVFIDETLENNSTYKKTDIVNSNWTYHITFIQNLPEQSNH